MPSCSQWRSRSQLCHDGSQLPALTARLGAVNAEAVVVSEGGTVGDVSLGRYSTIIKPVSIPTTVPISRAPVSYAVAAGESLATIAAKYGVTVSQIRWSNTNRSRATRSPPVNS